jgi:uncharacterized protein (TIGR02145 family)/uncharacterized repeat protein (TIGR02543 family)
MTGIKKFPIRTAGLVILLTSFFFTCEKIPEYCGDGHSLNPATQFCFGGVTYDKCAGAEYNPTNQTCDNGLLKNRCAGGNEYFNPQTEFCLNGNVFSKCGGNEFDPITQTCISNILRTICGDGRTVPLGTSCEGHMHILTTTAAPVTGGTINRNPNEPSYAPGTMVGVTADAAEGYTFTGWSGASTSTNATVTITMDDDKSLVAIFNRISDPGTTTHPLTTTAIPEHGGTITRSPNETHYAAGTQVTVTATAAPGYRFTGWGGASTSTTPGIVVSMDAPRALIANFEPITHLLTINRSPIAGGNVTPASGLRHSDNTPVTIAATPASGFRFVNWTVTGGGTVANADNAMTTITLRTDATVTANFQQMFTLTIDRSPEAGGSVTPQSGLSHDANTPVTITATPASGYRFVNWTVTSGTATIGNANNANTTVTLSSNATIRANFELITYTLTVDRNLTAGGTVTPASGLSHNANTPVTITATPASGYRFVNWTVINGTAMFGSTTNSNTTITLSSNTTIRANFEQVFAFLVFVTGVAPAPDNGGTVTPLSQSGIAAGTPIPITATPASGYTFVNWTVINGIATFGSATNPNTTVTLGSDAWIRANFAWEPGWQFNPNITYGSFTDSRDGRSYRTVVVGTQTWMAENLNFNASGSVCFGNDSGNCNTSGRLYDWATVMGFASTCNSISCTPQVQSPHHRGICPVGWHVPSNAEWETLIKHADPNGGNWNNVAGPKLRSTTGWCLALVGSVPNTDEFGFSALPGGNRNVDGSFTSDFWRSGSWWSATENDADNAWDMGMDCLRSAANTYWDYKAFSFSLRCVMD